MLKRLNYKLLGYPFQSHDLIRSDPGLTPFTRQDLPPAGNTLFLLGTGKSVHELKDSDWATIRKQSSFALNFFSLHAHSPSLYFYEPRPHHFAHYLRVMEERHADESYRVCVNASHFEPSLRAAVPDVPETFRFYAPLIFRNIWPGIYPFWFHTLPFWARKSSTMLNWTLHMTGSMTIPLSLAVYMGFKKIVMVGVDLTADGHFYYDYTDELSLKLIELEENLYREENRDAKDTTVHFTDDPKHRYPMRKVIDDLYRYMMKPRGVELFVSSRASRLSDTYPVYRFPDDDHG